VLLRRGDRPGDRRQAALAAGVPDGRDRVADLVVVAVVVQGRFVQPAGVLELDQRDVGLLVVPDHPAGVRPPVRRHRHGDLGGAVDDVVVGEHQPVLAEHHSGPGTRTVREDGVDEHHAGLGVGGRVLVVHPARYDVRAVAAAGQPVGALLVVGAGRLLLPRDDVRDCVPGRPGERDRGRHGEHGAGDGADQHPAPPAASGSRGGWREGIVGWRDRHASSGQALAARRLRIACGIDVSPGGPHRRSATKDGRPPRPTPAARR
jgi:hypothetical protein